MFLLPTLKVTLPCPTAAAAVAPWARAPIPMEETPCFRRHRGREGLQGPTGIGSGSEEREKEKKKEKERELKCC